MGLRLGDGTAKIFLNAKGTLDDVSGELKAFLDYVAGEKPEDPYVEKLEEAVEKAKQNRGWRHEYMTLLMRDQENLEKGRAEGRAEGHAEGHKEGREEGIAGMISSFRDLSIPDSITSQKLQEKFSLTKEEAQKYLNHMQASGQ